MADLRSAVMADFLLVSLLFLAWRVSLTLVTYVGSEIAPRVANGGPGSVGEGRSFDYWTSWAQWDGGWYLSIARDGYTAMWGSPAFFPFYPLLIRLGELFTGSFVTSGLLIAHASFLGFLFVFYRLVKERAGEELAVTATITYLAFPTAFYGVAMYTEGLFLLLLVLTFFSLERDNLLAGALFAGLAAATRLVGVAAFIPLALYALQRWDWQRRTLAEYSMAALLCLLPLGVHCIYLWREFGDPLFFQTISQQWNRQPSNAASTVLNYFDFQPLSSLVSGIELGSLVLFAVVLLLGFRKIPLALWLFSAAAFVVPLSSGILMSLPRYVLAVIGGFVIIAMFLQEHPRMRWAVWTGSLMLQAVLAVRFVNGHWVA